MICYIIHKSIYTPASCDVSVYQYQCTELQLAGRFFLFSFLISERQNIPTAHLCYVHALKTSFNCPHRPKLYDQLPEFTAVRVGAEKCPKKFRTSLVCVVSLGNWTNGLFHFHNSRSKINGIEPSIATQSLYFQNWNLSLHRASWKAFPLIHNYNLATSETIAHG